MCLHKNHTVKKNVVVKKKSAIRYTDVYCISLHIRRKKTKK